MFEKARPINAVSGAYDPGAQTLAVDAKNVVMRFGAAVALRGIDFQSETGKIHALVGANGAGKSTFLGIIAGRLRPTLGDVAIFGRPYDFGSPRHARQLGIAAIYQELTIVSAMSTQANVFLGQSIARAGLLAQRQMRDEFLRFLCKRFAGSPYRLTSRPMASPPSPISRCSKLCAASALARGFFSSMSRPLRLRRRNARRCFAPCANFVARASLCCLSAISFRRFSRSQMSLLSFVTGGLPSTARDRNGTRTSLSGQ